MGAKAWAGKQGERKRVEWILCLDYELNSLPLSAVDLEVSLDGVASLHSNVTSELQSPSPTFFGTFVF